MFQVHSQKEGNYIGEEGGTDFSENTSWTEIKSLNLYRNYFRYNHAEIWRKNANWPNLREINKAGSSLGPEGAVELRKIAWTHLQTLDLSNNYLGARGATELSKNTTWVNLHTLKLQENRINAGRSAEFGKNTSWITCESLI